MQENFFDHIPLPRDRAEGPLVLPWSAPNNPLAFLRFSTLDEWRTFVADLSPRCNLPHIVLAKFRRSQKLYYLAWVDFDLIKAGEMVALATLELALKDRYGNMKFSQLLQHMVQKDGLTDACLPIIQRAGGTALPQLLGEVHPSLAEIRNSLDHGDPFDGLSWAGLLELVRDLIDYAYRNFDSA